MIARTTVAIVLCLTAAAAAQQTPLVSDDFESTLDGWHGFWSRGGVGAAAIDTNVRHAGRQSARIDHPGKEDWSLTHRERLPVAAGELYCWQAHLRLQGEGSATLSVILRDAEDRVIDWSYGGRQGTATDGWQHVRSRFVVPRGARSIEPRLIGSGAATVWIDDALLTSNGTLDAMRTTGLPERIRTANESVEAVLFPVDGRIEMTDRRTGRRWTQRAVAPLAVLDAQPAERGFDVHLLQPSDLLALRASFRLEDDAPEMTVELASDADVFADAAEHWPDASATPSMRHRLAFPHPFATEPGMTLIMPVNEGISYPVDDATLEPMWYHLFGGHGLCMGWYGVVDGEQGLMAIVETPDDAAVQVPRIDGRLTQAPQWLSQKQRFGPPRRLRYVLLERGGYVAMCKRYRRFAERAGLVRTLAEKRAANENVDRLVGAVNVWCWDRDSVDLCREMQAVGIERILWSHRGEPESIAQLNAMGVLTSRYDIYQDVMDPANFPQLHGVHSDWTIDAWSDDLMIDAAGNWIRGWRVRGKDGKWYPCGVCCDRQAVAYARRRIAEELKTHPYGGRFIDTTTASPWRECYDEDHPLMRSESRQWKMRLLGLISDEFNLITGSETGHEAAVPVVHFFEGMMSLGPYRVPDAGRAMMRTVDPPPERVAKFQTGHFYRLPLWELVYHDCVVAYWYWGDYSNKLPALWDRRDLLNALYGTPPMFMFDRARWKSQRDRFIASYRTATPVARATGYVEMTSHRWLTADHAVQQTEFANGMRVTVNFGEQPYEMPDGDTLPPLSHRVEAE